MMLNWKGDGKLHWREDIISPERVEKVRFFMLLKIMEIKEASTKGGSPEQYPGKKN